MYRIALRPEELRPPVPFLDSNKDFSGVSVVISAYALPILQRVPAVMGLYFLSAMFAIFAALRAILFKSIFKSQEPELRRWPFDFVLLRCSNTDQLFRLQQRLPVLFCKLIFVLVQNLSWCSGSCFYQ